MASPSCSSAPGIFKYEVFLSYRGEDTGKTFTSHLRDALVDYDINTYGDFELERGKEIAPALLKAIEESKLSVVIFSQHYASSTWCLDELAHILECKQRHQQLVIPIFYDVDPSHVRYQRESFAAAFVQHEQQFKDTPDKVVKWKHALTNASNLAGFDSRRVRLDSKLVKKVVQDILNKLDRSVAEDECFRCGGKGHWANDCPLSGDHEKYGMQMGRDSSSGRSNYGVGDRSSVRRNECFNCGHPGHWARNCPYAADQEMQGRRSPHWEDVCFKCGLRGHWQQDCPSENGGERDNDPN